MNKTKKNIDFFYCLWYTNNGDRENPKQTGHDVKGKVNKMTEMNTNEFNNTIGEIRKLCKTLDQFATATYGLCAAHSRALAKKYGYDDASVSWGFENTFDNMNVIFKHYTDIDTLTYVILETV